VKIKDFKIKIKIKIKVKFKIFKFFFWGQGLRPRNAPYAKTYIR